jgi:hypothetical protein
LTKCQSCNCQNTKYCICVEVGCIDCCRMCDNTTCPQCEQKIEDACGYRVRIDENTIEHWCSNCEKSVMISEWRQQQ